MGAKVQFARGLRTKQDENGPEVALDSHSGPKNALISAFDPVNGYDTTYNQQFA